MHIKLFTLSASKWTIAEVLVFREHAPSELISNLANLNTAYPHGMTDPHSETEAIEIIAAASSSCEE